MANCASLVHLFHEALNSEGLVSAGVLRLRPNEELHGRTQIGSRRSERDPCDRATAFGNRTSIGFGQHGFYAERRRCGSYPPRRRPGRLIGGISQVDIAPKRMPLR